MRTPDNARCSSGARFGLKPLTKISLTRDSRRAFSRATLAESYMFDTFWPRTGNATSVTARAVTAKHANRGGWKGLTKLPWALGRALSHDGDSTVAQRHATARRDVDRDDVRLA